MKFVSSLKKLFSYLRSICNGEIHGEIKENIAIVKRPYKDASGELKMDVLHTITLNIIKTIDVDKSWNEQIWPPTRPTDYPLARLWPSPEHHQEMPGSLPD